VAIQVPWASDLAAGLARNVQQFYNTTDEQQYRRRRLVFSSAGRSVGGGEQAGWKNISEGKGPSKVHIWRVQLLLVFHTMPSSSHCSGPPSARYTRRPASSVPRPLSPAANKLLLPSGSRA